MTRRVSPLRVRLVTQVEVIRSDGLATYLRPGDRVWWSRTGREKDREELRSVTDLPQVLGDPRGWIEYTTEITRDLDIEEREPWQQQADKPEWMPAIVRLYARAVIAVALAYEPGDAK